MKIQIFEVCSMRQAINERIADMEIQQSKYKMRWMRERDGHFCVRTIDANECEQSPIKLIRKMFINYNLNCS